MQFKNLEIIPPILKALEEENYNEPTSIQAQAIPHILQNRDILGSAQTGTGKTAAFSIPILQKLTQQTNQNKKGKRNIQALILTPTRELAIQIDESLATYGRHLPIAHTVIFGGVPQLAQTIRLQRGVDILVATPGRLLDLMDQGFIHLENVKYFVLDEADRMLDMGFIHDVRRIIALLPTQRQSLFFSATMPHKIVELSRKILTNPVKVAVDPVSSTADTIQQYLYYTNKADKLDLLTHILQNKELNQVLVFSRTKHGSDKVVRKLKKKNINSAAIHGDKSQNQRQKALAQFKDKQIRVLVATDIAARGIDIDKLRFVINYDIPNVAETYVHRIGRSGRAGEDGIAYSICEPEENGYLKDIEKLIGKTIEVVEDNPFPQSDKPMSASEKKEAEKEKQRKKQAYFAAQGNKQPRKYSKAGSRR